MNTLAQYLPAMREAPGRIYFPGHAVVGLTLAAVLVVSAGVLAMRYPTNKAQEAITLLGEYGGRTLATAQGVNAALDRTRALLSDQPEWFQKATLQQVDALQEKLQAIPSLAIPTPEQVIAQARARQLAYDQAQQLIAASPFRDLPDDQVPLTAEGKQLLEARKVEPAERFEYQQLMTGAVVQLATLRTALELQAKAQTLAHQIDVRINGDKAAPLGEIAAGFIAHPPQEVEPSAPATTERDSHKLDFGAMWESGTDRSRQGAKQTPATAVDPLAAAEARALAEQQEAERQAAATERQAKAAAAAAQAKARRNAERAEWEAKRQAAAEQQAIEQAQREAQRLAQQAEQEAAQQARAAEAAAKAKAAECTSSIPARIRCASQGYNPLTGEKRGE